MAERQAYEIGTRADMDYAEHERTYGLFLTMIKGGMVIIIAILILMAIFLL